MSELTAATEAVKKGLEDFKANNDVALAEKADRGYVDSQIKEKSDKMLADVFGKIDEVNESLAKIEAEQEKAELFGDRDKGDDAKNAQILSALVGNTVDVAAYRNYVDATDKYLRKGEKSLSGDMQAFLQVGSDPSGGYWVEPDTSGRMVKKIFETSNMRALASVDTIGTDALEGPSERDQAASGGWVGETQPRTETDTPTINTWRIPVHEQFAQPKVTQKLLDDSGFNVQSWLSRKTSEILSQTENTAFFTGDGNAKPRGILSRTFVSTNDSTRSWGDVQYLPTGVSADFAASDKGDIFIDALMEFKVGFRSNFRWVLNRGTLGTVMKIKDGQGNYLWQPDFTNNGFGLRLIGYPVVEAEDMPAIAADSLSILCGDFRSAYQIVDRQGIRVLRDPLTDKPFIKFYTTKRVGADVLNSEAYKAIKFSAS
jgi:HK97 family phage major capsid protein